MIFIHDTRDKPGQHDNVESYLTEHGHKIVRSKMYVADIALLNDQSTVIDLKKGLSEVYSNLVNHKSHDRVRREMLRAQEAGIRLIFLIEQNGIHALDEVHTWTNPRIADYNSLKSAHEHGKMLSKPLPKNPPISSERLMNIMRTMQDRYGCEWRFCDKRNTGAEIIRLLEELRRDA